MVPDALLKIPICRLKNIYTQQEKLAMVNEFWIFNIAYWKILHSKKANIQFNINILQVKLGSPQRNIKLLPYHRAENCQSKICSKTYVKFRL